MSSLRTPLVLVLSTLVPALLLACGGTDDPDGEPDPGAAAGASGAGASAGGGSGAGATTGKGGSATAGKGGGAIAGSGGASGGASSGGKGGTAGSASGGTSGSAGTAGSGTAGKGGTGSAGTGSAGGGNAGAGNAGTGSAGNGTAGTAAGGTGGTGTAGSANGGAGSATAPTGTLFTQPNAWTKDVSALPPSAESSAIIGWLANQGGGWATGTLKIDFSIEVLTSDASTPVQPFTPTDDFYDPDCDHVPFPVPQGGALEGQPGYACVDDGDCHLIVVDPAASRLYEMWRANIDGSGFSGGCAAVWDLTRAYPASGRGEGCTSADAGGFPIAAMLFSADEVFAGEIPHALRFILRNQQIRDNVYVHPATHSTFPTSGGPNAPPYGVRFRLRQDFPLATLPTEGARVVAKALQKYGMLLADGGNITLTAQSDRFTTHKWSEVGVSQGSLGAIKVTDFEVVDMGAPITWSGDCTRNPLADDQTDGGSHGNSFTTMFDPGFAPARRVRRRG